MWAIFIDLIYIIELLIDLLDILLNDIIYGVPIIKSALSSTLFDSGISGLHLIMWVSDAQYCRSYGSHLGQLTLLHAWLDVLVEESIVGHVTFFSQDCLGILTCEWGVHGVIFLGWLEWLLL